MRAYSYALEERETDGPFLERFTARGLELVFLAAHHENRRAAPTFRLVDEALAAQRVGVVVVEGVPTSLGLDPPALLESFERSVQGDFYPMGEPSYAALGARERGIAFVGGEPDEGELRAAVREAGFDDRDLVGFYFVRQVPQYQRSGELERSTLPDLYAGLTAHYRSRLGLRLADQSYEAFLAWYHAANGKPFDLATFDPEEAAPVEDGAFRTQRLSHVVGVARDRHVVQLVDELLREHGSVLVVFGKSHLACQRPAYEALLGQGERLGVSSRPLSSSVRE